MVNVYNSDMTIRCKIFSIGTVVKPLPEVCPENPNHGLSESESGRECRFCCGNRCGKCDLATFLNQGCPSLQDDTVFPFLFPKKLSEWEFQRLKVKLWNASRNILESFASLEHDTISMLKEKNIPLDEVLNYVLTLGPMYNESMYEGKPLLLQEREKIEMVKDFGSLFLILKRYYSWFSYGMIEALRKEFLFHKETEHDEKLNKYKADFKDYCRHRIFECPKDMFPKPHYEGFVPLILKVEDDFEMYTLKRIENFRLSISEILGFSRHTLQLCNVTDGCVTVVFKIPSWLGDVIIITSEQQQKLVDIEVKELRVATRTLHKVRVSLKSRSPVFNAVCYFMCLRMYVSY